MHGSHSPCTFTRAALVPPFPFTHEKRRSCKSYLFSHALYRIRTEQSKGSPCQAKSKQKCEKLDGALSLLPLFRNLCSRFVPRARRASTVHVFSPTLSSASFSFLVGPWIPIHHPSMIIVYMSPSSKRANEQASDPQKRKQRAKSLVIFRWTACIQGCRVQEGGCNLDAFGTARAATRPLLGICT